MESNGRCYFFFTCCLLCFFYFSLVFLLVVLLVVSRLGSLHQCVLVGALPTIFRNKLSSRSTTFRTLTAHTHTHTHTHAVYSIEGSESASESECACASAAKVSHCASVPLCTVHHAMCNPQSAMCTHRSYVFLIKINKHSASCLVVCSDTGILWLGHHIHQPLSKLLGKCNIQKLEDHYRNAYADARGIWCICHPLAPVAFCEQSFRSSSELCVRVVCECVCAKEQQQRQMPKTCVQTCGAPGPPQVPPSIQLTSSLGQLRLWPDALTTLVCLCLFFRISASDFAIVFEMLYIMPRIRWFRHTSCVSTRTLPFLVIIII